MRFEDALTEARKGKWIKHSEMKYPAQIRYNPKGEGIGLFTKHNDMIEVSYSLFREDWEVVDA